MKSRLFSLSIEEQRAAIRERLDGHRLSRKPVCHMVLADDDYAAMLGESLCCYPFEHEFTQAQLLALVDVPAYEAFHGIKLVRLSDRAEHVATVCTDESGSAAA